MIIRVSSPPVMEMPSPFFAARYGLESASEYLAEASLERVLVERLRVFPCARIEVSILVQSSRLEAPERASRQEADAAEQRSAFNRAAELEKLSDPLLVPCPELPERR